MNTQVPHCGTGASGCERRHDAPRTKPGSLACTQEAAAASHAWVLSLAGHRSLQVRTGPRRGESMPVPTPAHARVDIILAPNTPANTAQGRKRTADAGQYSIGTSGGFPFRQLEGEGEGETGESREGRRSLPHRLHGRTREAMAGAAGTRRQPAAREGAWTERRSLRVRSR